jgi:hypothetical protein
VSAFALIHGGGSSAWDWHLVAAELEEGGHEPIPVDLPTENESAGWWDYADAIVDAVGIASTWSLSVTRSAASPRRSYARGGPPICLSSSPE